MLTSEAAGFAVRIAKGLIDLGRRVDLLLAEKGAVEAPLALPLPQVALEPTPAQMKKALRKLAAETEEQVPDPLGAEREALEAALSGPADAVELWRLLRKLLPEQALARMLDLDGAFVVALKEIRPDWAAERDLVAAAFFLGPGADERKTSYSWRIALTVVDALAELGADTSALFTRDERLRSLVSAVLRRFGEADLQRLDGTREILRAALGATLNGALDARADLVLDERWVGALLDALASARDAQPADERDDYVVGLLRGEGYPALVATVLEVGARQLDEDATDELRALAADFLREVSVLVGESPGFEDFFEAHWGDLLRAGLGSIQRHGPALLAGENAILGDVLASVAGALAARADAKLLTGDTLVALVDATIAVVAADPALVEGGIDQPWLAALVRSVVDVVADEGLRASFTKDGLETMLRGALTTFAEHPELIATDGGLAHELVGGVLGALAEVDTFAAEELASAAIGAALETLAEHPELVDFEYAELVSSLAGKVGALVREKRLSKVQGGELVGALVAVIAENPWLFMELEEELAALVLEAVLAVAEEDELRLLAGTTLVETLAAVVRALATSGEAALDGRPVADLVEQLGELVAAGLARAAKELGHRLGLGALPGVLGQLVVVWSRGELATLDPENPNFKRVFAEIAARAA